MSLRASQLLEQEETSQDQRWLLVDRIVASQCFAKSARLSSFLTCICDLARDGQLELVSEQYIGTIVFGRRPDYDPGIDSIVRSHASRLRHRLAQYFSEEGAHEEWVLTIPKGSYIPVFNQRERQPAPFPDESVLYDQPEPPAVPMLPDAASLEARVDSGPNLPVASATAQADRNLVPLLSWLLAAMTLIALACAGVILYDHGRFAVTTPDAPSESKRLLWSHLFNGKDQTLVVNADSGLVMLQGFTKQPVDLPMYLNGTYLATQPSTGPMASQILNLATRRYTSVVDLSITTKILRMTGVDLKNTKFVYARDLRPDQIKQSNLVLLGTYESTPWVQLFEPGMNFYFKNDLAKGVFSVINRQPQAGEQPAYDSAINDPQKIVYGVVAYRPSLNGSNKVLILEGQSMAGTESAADFAFDDGYLIPFLHSIRRPDGTIPYFELLVRSASMSGESSRLEIVAKRIEDH